MPSIGEDTLEFMASVDRKRARITYIAIGLQVHNPEDKIDIFTALGISNFKS
jgi:hypothetical protein